MGGYDIDGLCQMTERGSAEFRSAPTISSLAQRSELSLSLSRPILTLAARGVTLLTFRSLNLAALMTVDGFNGGRGPASDEPSSVVQRSMWCAAYQGMEMTECRSYDSTREGAVAR